MSIRVILRSEWGARHGRGFVTDGAKMRWIIHHDGHTRSRPDMTFEQECALMRFYENFHATGLTKTNPRIAYSFATMQSGRIYEGCGWGRVGAHTGGLNSSAYANFFPLNGAITAPTSQAVAADQWLRAEGIRLGHLSPRVVVSGHQDHGKPACPGRLVYNAVVLGAPTPRATPTLSEVISAHPTLRLGKGGAGARQSERDAVKYLQGRLITTGHMKAHLPSGADARTGFFGELTDKAVRSFQKAKGLTVDGIVGAKSWRALGV